MTIETLIKERDLARKNGQTERLLVLNDLIGKARAKATAGKKKTELTERMVNDTLVEYRKMLKDGIAKAPEGHAVRAKYEAQFAVVMEFCPPVMEDEIQIENLITLTLYKYDIPISRKTKGKMMGKLMPEFRARYVDMDIAMPIIEFMIAAAEAAEG